MYPKVFTDFAAYVKKYGDVSPVPTDVMFYGLRKGDETEVEIETGQDPVHPPAGRQRAQRARACAPCSSSSTATRARCEVLDKRFGKEVAARPKADKDNLHHLGSPMPGTVVEVKAAAGDEVKEGDKLVVLEAMKMEMTLASPLAGVIKEITVKPEGSGRRRRPAGSLQVDALACPGCCDHRRRDGSARAARLQPEGRRLRGADLASDAATGVALAREQHPDLVLLDIMLPDASGLDVCRMLKSQPATRDTQVMMVTAKGEEIDRVVGFELGADDYVVKPFSTRELLLRVQAVLRRRPGAASPCPRRRHRRRGPHPLRVLLMDRGAHRAWVEDAEVQLTALEFKLLGTLYDRRDRVQTRGALLEDVWGASADMATRTVDTHVKRLREKLGAAGDYIETVRGVGYRFLGKAE